MLNLLPTSLHPLARNTRSQVAVGPAGGVLALVAALALWGLVYVAPAIASDVPPALLAGLRYGVHGLVSLVILRRVGAPTDARTWIRAARHAATGFVGYYALVTTAVHIGGATLVVLMIATSPVVYTLAGRPGVPARLLALPVLAVVVGGITAGVDGPLGDLGVGRVAVTVVLAGVGIAMWTWYGLDNAKVVADEDVDLTRWTATTGVAAGLLSLPLIAFGMTALPSSGSGIAASSILVVAVIGLGSTTVANRAWNTASRRLAPSVVGPLLVLETVFTMTYAHLLDGSMPTTQTLIGEGTLLAGAAGCLLLVANARRSQRELVPAVVVA